MGEKNFKIVPIFEKFFLLPLTANEKQKYDGYN